jgi:isopentenyldiphosphate isomerase
LEKKKRIVVAVWLLDAKTEKVLLQQRKRTKTQSFPFIYQPTWNEKLEPGESLKSAVIRGAKEELGPKFQESFNFDSLRIFNIMKYIIAQNQVMLDYNFVGVINDKTIKKIKLHSEARRIVKVTHKEMVCGNIKSIKDPDIDPKRQIVLFEDQYLALRHLFSLKELFTSF